MIIEVRANNVFVFNEPITFSLEADMRSSRFSSNVYKEANFNILKVSGIYGANNSGKTCLIKCISVIRNVLLNKKFNILSNLFTKNPICELGITFLYDKEMYSYDFKFDVSKEEFIFEKFIKIEKDCHNNEKTIKLIHIDRLNKKFDCADKMAEYLIPNISGNNILIHLLKTENFESLDKIKNTLHGFASKIDIINMNNIPIKKTIELLKKKNKINDRIIEFVKKADLYLDKIEYNDSELINIEFQKGKENNKPDEAVLRIPKQLIEQLHLGSTYKGVLVPSLLFDSTGTKKIVALASYIVEALEQGRILVVDELDSSLHFKLTRAIVAMFNNELNSNAQLIFTVHDINLMDCKKLFRKEQIWFIHKDNTRVYVYSLADFTAEKGVRETTDIIEKYRKGALGALPEPELINILLEINSDEKERKNEK